MKYVGMFISSICVFFIILLNFYYNSLTLDMQKIKEYVVESNIILEDIITKEEKVNEKKGEYISRLIKLEECIENVNTSFIIKDYKEYKIASIQNLIKSISEPNKKDEYLENVDKYNDLCNKEIENLMDNIIK